MASYELQRTVVKSPPELWEELSSEQALGRWLGPVRVCATEPPSRLEWDGDVARGVIELEASGWGTIVRALAETDGEQPPPGADRPDDLERRLNELLDDLGSSSLTSG